MATPEGKAPEEKEKPEEKKPERIVTISSPLEAPEFQPLLELYMKKLGGEVDPRQAAILLAGAFKNMGVDPYEDINKAIKVANDLTNILSVFPDTPITSQTKDVVMGTAVTQIGKRALAGPARPSMEERMERMMEIMMPWKAAIEMMRGGLGTQGEGKSAEVARLETELAHVKEKLAEKPIEELKSVVLRMEADLKALKETPRKPAEEGEGKVVEALKDLKTTITEKDRAKELEGLEKGLVKMGEELSKSVESLKGAMQQGAPKEDVLTQATSVLNSVGTFFQGFGGMAKTMGYEKAEAKMTGDRWRDMMELGRKALETFGDVVKYYRAPAPERKVVQAIPIEEKPAVPAPAAPAPAEAPAEAPPAEAPPEAPQEEKGLAGAEG